jgi:hypothetical protein
MAFKRVIIRRVGPLSWLLEPMSKIIEAKALFEAVAASGYFDSPSFDPTSFCLLVENDLSISRDRAIDLLTNSGLTLFEYSDNSSLAAKDRLDEWRLVPTESGQELLSQRAGL